MPIHERLYRRLEVPPQKSSSYAPWAIASYNSKYILKGWFAKLVYWGSLAPFLVITVMLYVASQQPEGALGVLSMVTGTRVSSLGEVPAEVWNRLGSNLIYFFVGMIQGWFALIVTAFVGASQIAGDLRSHAFEVYLARPIKNSDYVLGKLLVIVRPLIFVMFVPACGVLLASNLLFPETFRPLLPFYGWAFVAALVQALINGIVMLGISSLGKSSRYATIIWFSFYFVSFIVATTLTLSTGNTDFELISYRHNVQILLAELLSLVPYEAMDLELPFLDRPLLPSILILAGLTGTSLWLVMRRLRSGRL